MPITDISSIDLEKEIDNFTKELVRFTVTMLHFFKPEEFFDVLTDKLYSYLSCVEDMYKVNIINELNKFYIAEHHPEMFEAISKKLEKLSEDEDEETYYKEEQ
jgi:hypothetical protein